MVILIFFHLADLLFENGDYFNAITEYKRMLFLKEEEEKYLFYKIGECYERMNDLEKAIYYYGKYYFLEDSPPDSFLFKYACLLFKIQKFKEGIRILEGMGKSEKRDYLLSYGYLNIDDVKNALYYLPDKKIYKNPNFSLYFSLLFQGVPLILNGSYIKGITSLFIGVSSCYLIYKSLRERDYFRTSISTYIFVRFHIGNYIFTKNYLKKKNILRIEEKIKKLCY